jgi:hypothetical protein
MQTKQKFISFGAHLVARNRGPKLICTIKNIHSLNNKKSQVKQLRFNFALSLLAWFPQGYKATTIVPNCISTVSTEGSIFPPWLLPTPLFFESESCYVARAGLEFSSLLSQPPKCWDHSCAPPCLSSMIPFKGNQNLFQKSPNRFLFVLSLGSIGLDVHP